MGRARYTDRERGGFHMRRAGYKRGSSHMEGLGYIHREEDGGSN